jgi:hypothetical protein
MLHGLSRRDETGVQRSGSLELVHDRLAFLDDTENGVAGFSARWLAEQLKHLFQALYMPFGLREVLLKTRLQFLRLRGLGHPWQRFGNLPLGVVDVLERIEE